MGRLTATIQAGVPQQTYLRHSYLPVDKGFVSSPYQPCSTPRLEQTVRLEQTLKVEKTLSYCTTPRPAGTQVIRGGTPADVSIRRPGYTETSRSVYAENSGILTPRVSTDIPTPRQTPRLPTRCPSQVSFISDASRSGGASPLHSRDCTPLVTPRETPRMVTRCPSQAGFKSDATRSSCTAQKSTQSVTQKTTVTYKCPTCNESFLTFDRAVQHCRKQGGEKQAVLEGGSTSQPVQSIGRYTDPNTGNEYTVVQGADGGKEHIGEKTVQWLLTATEEASTQWIEDSNLLQLRGIAQEVGHRLVKLSNCVQVKMKESSELRETVNYAILGLDPDATDKELDAAYRGLAKRMHPDKNGGTDEAKFKFQQMKERYENLKQNRRRGGLSSSLKRNFGRKPGKVSCLEDGEVGEDREEPVASLQSEDAAAGASEDCEDEQQAPPQSKTDNQNGAVITYDPEDRKSITETIWKMVGNLKGLSVQLQGIDEELSQLKGELSSCNSEQL